MKYIFSKLLVLIALFSCISIPLNAEETSNTPIRIMPLGDSITYGFLLSDAENPRPTSVRTAYRNHLWYMLKDANYTADFVGSRVAGEAIVPAFDPDNEGHPGWTANELAQETYGYMLSAHPNIVLLHIGTNDVDTSSDGINAILDNIDIYEQESQSVVRVLVALPIGGRSAHEVASFNKNLEKLIKKRIIQGDMLTLVDMFRTAGLTSDDFADSIHPNDTGYQKMAKVWFDALMAPYTPALYLFPHTLVDSLYIESITVNETVHSVTFVSKIPNDGITF